MALKIVLAVACCLVYVSADPIRPRSLQNTDECLPTEDPNTPCRPDHNCTPIPDDPVGTCPVTPTSPCAIASYLPHRDNCQYFYECVRQKPVQMCCPEGTCFNPELNVCV